MRKLFLLSLLLLLIFPVAAQDELDCEASLEIWQIQGSGFDANCLNTRITLENNLVTAIGAKGFFVQTPLDRSDNDPLTSDGIYVYTNLPPIGFGVTVGDLVSVTGRIKESYNLTQIEVASRRQVEVISSGNDIPDPINLFEAELEWDVTSDVHPLERYEGMLVQVVDANVVAPTNYFDEFGISLTGERVFREMGIERDLTPEFIGMDLPEFDLNPELLEVDPPEMGFEVEFVTVGSTVTVTGGLSYSYQDYQIWPRDLDITMAEYEPRPVRDRAEDEYTIATQNMLNLFDTVNDPRRNDSTGEDYVPNTTDLYHLRLEKMSEHVRINLGAPDILAIQEIENARTLTDLAMQIAQDDPSLHYYGCIQEGNDGRGIDNAYLVRTDRVNVTACYRMPDSLTMPTLGGAGRLFGRPPLVLEAELLSYPDALPITLIGLHVKSLSGSDTEIVQERRMGQAIRIAEFVQGLIDADPEANVVVLGDLNAFPYSDGLVDVVGIISGTHNPDEALMAPEADQLEPNLINQLERVPVNERYSYIYNSTSQVLDHILTSPALDAYITDAQFSRGNADALYTWEWEAGTTLRSSDHDGFVIYVNPNIGE